MRVPDGLSRRGMGVIAFWLTVILVVIADQATKVAVRHLMPPGAAARTLVPGLIDLVHVENTGAAFNVGRGLTWLFVACAVAAFLLAAYLVWARDLPLRLVFPLAAVAGGGAGNMIDRLATGSVTDFLAATFVDFPVFNVADVFVTCGVVASVLLYLRWEAERDRAGHDGDRRGRDHA